MDAQKSGFPRYTLFLLLFGLSCATGPALAATITVNTATDDFGSNLDNCSLREAIESANDNFDFGGCDHSGIYGDLISDNINLPELDPPGAFTLTRYTGHDNANNSTDLDIIGSVHINGFSAANTIIRGDTSDPDEQRERIFHIIEGTVTLDDMTIRDGFVDSGGDGGGLRTEPGSTTILNRVVVGLNIADGNGGGIWNRGTMTLNASAVTNNVTQSADVGGGGIYNTGVLNINDSRILTNRTEGLNVEGNGAGIYSLVELNMVNSHVNGNEIDVESALAEPIEGEGGGLYLHGTFHIEDSTISNNIARGRGGAFESEGADGGGIYCEGLDEGIIERSLITGNDALNMGASAVSDGGGIHGCAGLVISDSVISANLSEGDGGGIFMNGARMLRTTVYNNRAEFDGGGISEAGHVENSTIANNTAGFTGGGVQGSSGSFRNVTITGNIAENDDSEATSAGGITGGAGGPIITNSVIAGNTDNVNTSEDCDGTLTSLNYNLIQNATGCGGLNQEGLDKLNVQAELEALAANGGIMVGATVGTVPQQAMLTRMPQLNSNVLEIGDPAGCKDADGVLLLTDQIGRDRTEQGFDFNLGFPGVCDAGALEFSFVVFEDGFE
jgi:CSLREA domain-containing protein